jgi:hypothetical protein
VDHGWYEYNITVYDRAGNSADYEIETLNSSFSQAYYLVVDNNDTDPLAKIVTFKIRSNGQNIYIDVLDISMPDDNSLTVIKFDSQKQLNQEKPIPYELTVNPVKMLTTTYMYITLTFLEDLIDGEQIHLTFKFSDGSSKDISISSNFQ